MSVCATPGKRCWDGRGRKRGLVVYAPTVNHSVEIRKRHNRFRSPGYDLWTLGRVLKRLDTCFGSFSNICKNQVALCVESDHAWAYYYRFRWKHAYPEYGPQPEERFRFLTVPLGSILKRLYGNRCAYMAGDKNPLLADSPFIKMLPKARLFE